MKVITIGIKPFLFLAAIGWHFMLLGQNHTIDSLRYIIYHNKKPTRQLEALVHMTPNYQDMPNDSLKKYAVTGMALAKKLNDSMSYDVCRTGLAYYLSRDEQHDSAMIIADELLKSYNNRNGYNRMKGELLALKMRLLTRNFKNTQIITLSLKNLANLQQRKDTIGVAIAMNAIGWQYLEMGNYPDAKKWLLLALEQPLPPDELKKYNSIYSNLALAYYHLRKTDSAHYYIGLAIKYGRQFETLNFLANSLNFYSNILMDEGRLKSAEKAILESLEIRKKIGEPYYTAFNQSMLARFYAKNNEAERGIATCLETIDYAKKKNILSKLPQLYEVLAECYAAAGNIPKQLETMNLYIEIKDSLYTFNTSRLLAEASAKYEVQKKENQILQQQITITRSNYAIISVTGLALVLMLSGWMLYRGYKKRQHLKMQQVLALKEQEAKLDIIATRASERKRIAADLHDNLGAYAAALQANVEHLGEMLPEKPLPVKQMESNLQSMLGELSNTIWVLQKESRELIDIFDKLKRWGQQLQESYPATQMEFTESYSQEWILTPAVSLHTFYISQEAINNAFKHSKASLITISLYSNQNRWQLTISDNGNGFKDTPKKSGNGLKNMESRAAQAELILNLETSGTGTKVILSNNYAR